MLFLLSFLGAFLSSLPPGPTNLRLLYLHLCKSRKHVYAFQVGIILIDALVAMATLLACQKTYNYFEIMSRYKEKAIYVGSVLFIMLLLYLSFSHFVNYKKNLARNFVEKNSSSPQNISRIPVTFLSGVVGTLTIPGLVPFWYFWWIGSANILLNIPSIYIALLTVFLGLLIGDSLVFSGYRILINKIYIKYKRKFILSKLDLIVSLIFFSITLVFTFKLLNK